MNPRGYTNTLDLPTKASISQSNSIADSFRSQGLKPFLQTAQAHQRSNRKAFGTIFSPRMIGGQSIDTSRDQYLTPNERTRNFQRNAINNSQQPSDGVYRKSPINFLGINFVEHNIGEVHDSKDALKGPHKVSFGDKIGQLPKFEQDSEADASKMFTKSLDTSDLDKAANIFVSGGGTQRGPINGKNSTKLTLPNNPSNVHIERDQIGTLSSNLGDTKGHGTDSSKLIMNATGIGKNVDLPMNSLPVKHESSRNVGEPTVELPAIRN